MKKLILTLALCSLYAIGVYAQVGITGNNPDKSAVLDLNASNKGLLIPQASLLSLTDAGTIPSPAQGLLIYNTNAGIGIGFYYWDTGRWNRLATMTDALGDNLGNHIATRNIAMGANSISKDGGAGEGLMFDASGNATTQQQLNIKDLPNAGKAETVLTTDANGLLKKGSIDLSSIPRREAYLTTSVAAGSSVQQTLVINPVNTMFIIGVESACGKALATLYAKDDIITFAGGQGQNVLYTYTVANTSGTSQMLACSGLPPCAADGGNGTQFNFTVTKSGAMLTITNNGNIANVYTIRQVEM